MMIEKQPSSPLTLLAALVSVKHSPPRAHGGEVKTSKCVKRIFTFCPAFHEAEYYHYS